MNGKKYLMVWHKFSPWLAICLQQVCSILFSTHFQYALLIWIGFHHNLLHSSWYLQYKIVTTFALQILTLYYVRSVPDLQKLYRKLGPAVNLKYNFVFKKNQTFWRLLHLWKPKSVQNPTSRSCILCSWMLSLHTLLNMALRGL